MLASSELCAAARHLPHRSHHLRLMSCKSSYTSQSRGQAAHQVLLLDAGQHTRHVLCGVLLQVDHAGRWYKTSTQALMEGLMPCHWLHEALTESHIRKGTCNP